MSKREPQRSSTESSFVASTCEAFELHWSTSPEPPDIRRYVERVPASVANALFGELLLVDCRVRKSRGETVSSEDYTKRFPEFSQIVSARFASLEPPATTVGQVEESLADTQSLAGKDVPRKALDAQLNWELPVFDHYQLGKLLGQGGMGTVHEAKDTILNRVVAIKTIHPKRLSDSAVTLWQLAMSLLETKENHPLRGQVRGLRARGAADRKTVVGSPSDRVGRKKSGDKSPHSKTPRSGRKGRGLRARGAGAAYRSPACAGLSPSSQGV